MSKINQTLQHNVPSQLQYKVWFLVQFHFCRRGRENSHNLKKSDFIKSVNSSGKAFIYLRDNLTKNHRVSNGSKSSNAVLYEEGGTNCPIMLIEKYIYHLPIVYQILNYH